MTSQVERIESLEFPRNRELLTSLREAILDAHEGADGMKVKDNDIRDRLEREAHEAERARRVEKYAAQLDNTGSFEYDEYVVAAISAGRPNEI